MSVTFIPKACASCWDRNQDRLPQHCRVLPSERPSAARCSLWRETPGSDDPSAYGWAPPQHRDDGCACVPELDEPVNACAALLAEAAPAGELVDALERLYGNRNAAALAPVAIRALRHPESTVRLAAITAMSACAVPAVLHVLDYLERLDEDADVREAARKAGKAIIEGEERLALCLQCGSEGATLRPEAGNDPYCDPWPRPAFCDTECAAAWALAHVSAEFHFCSPAGGHVLGPAADCDACAAEALIGAAEAAAFTAT